MTKVTYLLLFAILFSAEAFARPNLAPKTPAVQNADPKMRSWPAYQSSWPISRAMYEKVKAYYLSHQKLIKNKRYVTIINIGLHASRKRFVLIDLESGKIETYLTAAGRNSDPDGDGYATSFSNEPDSKKTSLGFYLTLGPYQGIHGHSLKLRGLEASNSNAEVRAIVIHAAKYIQEDKKHAGRSWGCPSLDPKFARVVMDRIQAGSLLYIGTEKTPAK